MVTLQKISLSDVVLLRNLAVATFKEKFVGTTTLDNIEKYITDKMSVSVFCSELENDNCQFYLATSNNDIVGYLKVNKYGAQTELQDKTSLEIERIYVLNAFKRQGIGKFLLNKAIQIARDNELKYIWLGVWEHNNEAVGFYKNNGFLVFDTHIFTIGNDDQTDYLMRLDL